MVISLAANPPLACGPSTRVSPERPGNRPVISATRLGVHTGAAE